MKIIKKAILLVCDGLGDRPQKAYNNKTPLEYAHKPNLNNLAENSECGIMDVISAGRCVGSDTGHLALLGYDPYKIYTGRGPFEALGIGMEVQKGDVAFRCNFSTVDENLIVKDRRAGRIEKGTKELAASLNELEINGIKCLVKESVAHRAALVLRGDNLSSNISDADPHNIGEKIWTVQPLDESESAKKTAELVNEFVQKSYQILKEHPVNLERIKNNLPPANIILPRGAGLAPKIKSFEKQYKIKGGCLVEVGLLKGLAKYLEMDLFESYGATGGLDTDLNEMSKTAIKSLEKVDFLLWNIKGCDVAGHDGDFKAKVQMVEKIDLMIGDFIKKAENKFKDMVLVVTADHSTPVSVKDHSGDAVPIMFYGSVVRSDDIGEFSERSCAKGGAGRIKGTDLMVMITNLMGAQEKFGA